MEGELKMATSSAFDVRTDAEKVREDRARNQYVRVIGVHNDDFVFDFEGSDETHVVHTSGTEAEMCTCPDHQGRGLTCKHMAAYENSQYIDEWDF